MVLPCVLASIDKSPAAAIPPRSSLILPANNSIPIIPPTTPHTPLLNPVNPVNPVQNFYTLNTIYTGSKGSDPSVYALLYMLASYHLPPQQFYLAHASLYQPTTQSPSFHQPRHTIHFSILSILLILSKTSTRSTRLKICYLLFVYLVYFVVQIAIRSRAAP